MLLNKIVAKSTADTRIRAGLGLHGQAKLLGFQVEALDEILGVRKQRCEVPVGAHAQQRTGEREWHETYLAIEFLAAHLDGRIGLEEGQHAGDRGAVDEQLVADQFLVAIVVIRRDPAIVAGEHADAVPLDVQMGEFLETAGRARAAAHHERCRFLVVEAMLERIANDASSRVANSYSMVYSSGCQPRPSRSSNNDEADGPQDPAT